MNREPIKNGRGQLCGYKGEIYSNLDEETA
jgi:hypothetical protein